MNIDKRKFEHLLNNLERKSFKNSVFNYENGRKALLSLGQGSIREWLDTLLPNTRLIIEPKIIGSDIGIQYIEGKINKAINENCTKSKNNSKIKEIKFSRALDLFTLPRIFGYQDIIAQRQAAGHQGWAPVV